MVKDIVGKFANVASDEYEKYGLNKDDLVFIAGSGFAPVDDEDNFKLLFVVSKIIDSIPNPSNGVTIARVNLNVLPDDKSEQLLKEMEQKIAQERKEATSE